MEWELLYEESRPGGGGIMSSWEGIEIYTKRSKRPSQKPHKLKVVVWYNGEGGLDKFVNKKEIENWKSLLAEARRQYKEWLSIRVPQHYVKKTSMPF